MINSLLILLISFRVIAAARWKVKVVRILWCLIIERIILKPWAWLLIVLLLCILSTSISIVWVTCNVSKYKITEIIERCSGCTFWVKISLFIIKRSKIFFFISFQSFETQYSRLSTIIFSNKFARSTRTSSGFFDSLVLGCGVVDVSKNFLRVVYNAALASLSWQETSEDLISLW